MRARIAGGFAESRTAVLVPPISTPIHTLQPFSRQVSFSFITSCSLKYRIAWMPEVTRIGVQNGIDPMCVGTDSTHVITHIHLKHCCQGEWAATSPFYPTGTAGPRYSLNLDLAACRQTTWYPPLAIANKPGRRRLKRDGSGGENQSAETH